MADYSSIIQSAAKQYNIDPSLIRAVIQVESSGNPNAKSSVGAVGLGQLMPATAQALGVKDPTDPNQAIPAIANLLNENLNRYGNVQDALRAYHGGTDQKNWGPLTQAYPGKVLSNLPKQSQPTQPQVLPGIPTAAPSGTQSDDAIFSAFSKGGAPAQQQQGPQSDDAIFAAMTKSAAPNSAAVSPQASPQQPTGPQPGTGTSFLAGLGRGVQETALGAQQLLGHGLQSLGTTGQGMTPQGQSLVGAIGRAGDWLVNNANQGLQAGAQEVAPYQQAHPIATGAGNIGGAMAATAPLVIGAPVGTGLLGLAGRGAVSGAAMGAVSPVSPDSQNYGSDKLRQMGVGALLGAATPALVSGAVGAGRYAGNVIGSALQPFTNSGQQAIAENILARAAQGGPSVPNLSQLVAGSSPTLAEATANPGIATLQRTIRDISPNPFIAQEQQNAAARLGALERITGTADDLVAARAGRDTSAVQDYLSTHVGIPTSSTEYSALKQTPAFQSAFKQAQTMAKNAGSPSIETTVQNQANANMGGALGSPQTYVSGTGLHWIKQALDDQINSAAQAGEKSKASNLLGVKDQLLSLMDREIPGYAEARGSYAAASRPIDAMQYLQGMNLTDAQGNITLSKVQNALANIQKSQQKPGVNLAKSVNQSQIDALTAIRDDLLRASSTGLGRSAGSSTAQNLATQNMLQAALPGKLGALVGKLPAGTVGGTIGGGMGYLLGGPIGATLGSAAGSFAGRTLGGLANASNEQIQANLANMLLNPQLAAPALNRAAGIAAPVASNIGLQRLLYPAITTGGVRSLGGSNGRP